MYFINEYKEMKCTPELHISKSLERLSVESLELIKVGGDSIFLWPEELLIQVLHDAVDLSSLYPCYHLILSKPEVKARDHEYKLNFDHSKVFYLQGTMSIPIDKQLDGLLTLIQSKTRYRLELKHFQRLFDELLIDSQKSLDFMKSIYKRHKNGLTHSAKGVDAYSKYGAGLSNSSEFFHLFEKDSQVFFTLINSPSYLLSSSILEVLHQLENDDRSDVTIDDIIDEVMRLSRKYINQDDIHLRLVSLITCIYDTKSLKIKGHAFGRFAIRRTQRSDDLIFNNQHLLTAQLDDSFFETQLSPGESLTLYSSGYLKNLVELKRSSPVYSDDESITDKVEDAFYTINSLLDDGYYPHDCFVFSLKVKSHVLYKV